MATTDDYAAEILQALSDANHYTKLAIVAELEPLRAGYESAVEDAAKALAEAYKALESPRAAIAEMDSKIAEFQASANTWESRIDDDDVEQSVTAAFYHRGFLEHIAKLQDKRRELTESLTLLEEDHRQAGNALVNAQTEMNIFKLNLIEPYLHLGQQTIAYQAFRVGSFGLWVSMLNDSSPAEKTEFFHALDEISVRSGYTTDDLHERQRQWALEQGLQDYRENFPGAEKSSSPSGRDIVDGIHQQMMNQAADKTVNRIDYLPPPVRIPVAQREWMAAPHIAETAKKM